MANCKSCGCNQIDCGCKDKYLTTPAPCPTPDGCPEAQPCSEVFDSQCILYTATDIVCGQDTIVNQDDNVQTALQNIADYFCNTSPKKFVTQFSSVFDGDTKTILKSQLVACGLITDGCGYDTFTNVDFTYAIYYLNNGVWTSITNLDGVTLRVNDTTGDITINFNIAPISPAVTVRVVIIG